MYVSKIAIDIGLPHYNSWYIWILVQVAKNVLACRYHGWEFNENGKCKNIPQLSERDMLGNIKMTLDKRKHVKTY